MGFFQDVRVGGRLEHKNGCIAGWMGAGFTLAAVVIGLVAIGLLRGKPNSAR
jgi:hypothetical protein